MCGRAADHSRGTLHCRVHENWSILMKRTCLGQVSQRNLAWKKEEKRKRMGKKETAAKIFFVLLPQAPWGDASFIHKPACLCNHWYGIGRTLLPRTGDSHSLLIEMVVEGKSGRCPILQLYVPRCGLTCLHRQIRLVARLMPQTLLLELLRLGPKFLLCYNIFLPAGRSSTCAVTSPIISWQKLSLLKHERQERRGGAGDRDGAPAAGRRREASRRWRCVLLVIIKWIRNSHTNNCFCDFILLILRTSFVLNDIRFTPLFSFCLFLMMMKWMNKAMWI